MPLSAPPAWWREVGAAVAGRARWPGWRAPATGLRERLAPSARQAWRHRRSAIGTAWIVCLIGWTLGVLLPDGRAPGPTASAGADLTAAAGGGPPEDQPPSAAAFARSLQDSREELARLQADLDVALTLRAAQARQLAETPHRLAAGPNPIHRWRTIQLDQQDALLGTLRLRRGHLQAHIDGLEQRLRSPSGATAGRAATPAGQAGGAAAAAAAADLPTVASAPAPVTVTAAPRRAMLCGVLLLAAAAGAALALWRGRADGIIDHPSQLRQTALPIRCTIRLPAAPEQARRDRASLAGAALAGLGLLGLFAALVVAARLGALAPLGAGRLGGWAG